MLRRGASFATVPCARLSSSTATGVLGNSQILRQAAAATTSDSVTDIDSMLQALVSLSPTPIEPAGGSVAVSSPIEALDTRVEADMTPTLPPQQQGQSIDEILEGLPQQEAAAASPETTAETTTQEPVKVSLPERTLSVRRQVTERWGLSIGKDMILLKTVPESAVARAGLETNTLITHINGVEVKSFDDVKAVLANCIEEAVIGYTELAASRPSVAEEGGDWAVDSSAATDASGPSAVENELADKAIELGKRRAPGGNEAEWSAWADQGDSKKAQEETTDETSGRDKAKQMSDEELLASLSGGNLPTNLVPAAGGFYPVGATMPMKPRSREQIEKIELMRRRRARSPVLARFSPEEIRRKALALQRGADGVLDLALNGRVICFTGTLFMRREDARLRAEAVGASFMNSVSARTDILVVGQRPGANKLLKATANPHLDIWNEAQFLRAIGINEQQDLTEEQRAAIARGGLDDDRRHSRRGSALRAPDGSTGMVKSKLTLPAKDKKEKVVKAESGSVTSSKIRDDLRRRSTEVQFNNFWDPAVPIPECFNDPVDVAAVERDLGGYKLPAAYVELMQKTGQNGGAPLKCWVKNPRDTVEHWNIDSFFGLSRKQGGIADPESGSKHWIEKKDYPNIGLYFANTHSEGQDMWALDYTECGSLGEPKVVHVDEAAEVPFQVTVVANNFADFLTKLVLVDSNA